MGVDALTRGDVWCEGDVFHARQAEVLLRRRRSVVAVQEDVLEAVDARATQCATLQRRHQRLLLCNHTLLSVMACALAASRAGQRLSRHTLLSVMVCA